MNECPTHPDWKPTGMEYRCPHCAGKASLPDGYYQHSNGTIVNRYGKAVSANRLAELKRTRITGPQGVEQRERIRERDGYCCKHCGIAVKTGEVDHIKPLEHGGSNADANLQLLCRECHIKKTANDRGHVYRPGTNLDGTPADGSW